MTYKAFTFADVSLVPQKSDFEKNQVYVGTVFAGQELEIPVVSSPMLSLTNLAMLKALYVCGSIGTLHRYYKPPYKELVDAVSSVPCLISVSPSMGIDIVKECLDNSAYYYQGFVIDVAHGHTKRNLEYTEQVASLSSSPVISGNIVTTDALQDYYNAGATGFRVGIGGGSVCTTRRVVGVGIPQLSAVIELSEYAKENFSGDYCIISDGGHKTTGDIVKSLAFGADMVMLGYMLSGTKESNMPDIHSGMASEYSLTENGKTDFLAEGVTREVTNKGSVEGVIKNIKHALEQALYYCGAGNLHELREVPYVFVTQNGYLEGGVV